MRARGVDASMIRPLIQQFEIQAEVLDAQGSTDSLDDAVAALATWMSLAGDRLTEDDMVVLVGIGAVLYRHGLRQRLVGPS